MRILVLEPAARDERVGLHQRLDDGLVGIALLALVGEHALARKARRLARERTIGIDGEGDGGVDAARGELGLIGHPDLEVVAAMAGRGVHEAGAVLVRDVVAVEQGDVEVIAPPAQRMRAGQSDRIDVTCQLECVHLRRLHDGFGKLLGQNEPVTRLGPISFGRLRHLVQTVVDPVRKADRAVARKCPRRRGPDDNRRSFEHRRLCSHRLGHDRKLHPHHVAGGVVILDLGLGESRLFHHAPHHGLGAAV